MKIMSNKVQDMSEPLLVLALVEVAATMAAGRGLAPARAATKAEDREAEWEEEDVDGDDVESGTLKFLFARCAPTGAVPLGHVLLSGDRLVEHAANPMGEPITDPVMAPLEEAPPPPARAGVQVLW